MKKKQNKQENFEEIEKKAKFDLRVYAKYSSMFFQMAVIIGMGVFGGYLIDKWVGWKFPVFIILFSFISIVGAIYYVIKDLIK